MVFGPADSGKTFTMFGLESHVIAGELTERTSGLAQRCGRELFRLLALEGGDATAADPSFQPFNPHVEAAAGGQRPSTAPTGVPVRSQPRRLSDQGSTSWADSANRAVMYDDAVIGGAYQNILPADATLSARQRYGGDPLPATHRMRCTVCR